MEDRRGIVCEQYPWPPGTESCVTVLNERSDYEVTERNNYSFFRDEGLRMPSGCFNLIFTSALIALKTLEKRVIVDGYRRTSKIGLYRVFSRHCVEMIIGNKTKKRRKRVQCALQRA